MMSTSDLRWRRSSRSDNGGGNCVEIALMATSAVIRDSKNRDGGIVMVGEPAWERFRSAIS